MRNVLRYFVVATLFSILIPQNSYAYIDPGTGSYVIQIIIASVLGGLFALKGAYGKIIDYLKSLFTDNKRIDADE